MKDQIAVNQQTITVVPNTLDAPRPLSLRLSREEVQRKYAPTIDTEWTPEREAAFFASIPKRPVPAQSKARASLVCEYAKETLSAQRVTMGYLDALGAVLGAIAVADREGHEVRLSQRMAQYGAPQTLRTIQKQLERAGVLALAVREQGWGFVGTVYVHTPAESSWRSDQDLEEARERRAVSYPDESLARLGIVDVPF